MTPTIRRRLSSAITLSSLVDNAVALLERDGLPLIHDVRERQGAGQAVDAHLADQLVAALPQNDALSPRVRKLLLELLPTGSSDATRVAAKLGMSRRTLTRHLEREGVTYKELLEKARHQMALQYLEKSSLDPQQIAFMLGYSVTAAFSRAFARWEGKSPTEHRRTYRANQRN